MSYVSTEQPVPDRRRIDFASVAGVLTATGGLIALIVEVNVRGWWGLATSWVDMLVLVVWFGLAGWLSSWAFENAAGWWHIPSFLGAVASVIGLAFLLALAVISLVSEHPDILTDDSGQKRNRNRRRRTTGSSRRACTQETLTGVGLCVLLSALTAVMPVPGVLDGFSAWVGEVVADLVVGWLKQHQ
ncbi:MAG: hypothetical protein OXB92_06060 [Acidimicrobiaceae bacterium]|nr:hypothetical protein [Acidimicrobiia bacterium]MCY4493402.1 hypothetical protein [Acidimicrobiaceae bacterium]